MAVYGGNRGARGWQPPPKRAKVRKIDIETAQRMAREELAKEFGAGFTVKGGDIPLFVDGYIINPGEVIDLVPHKGVWMTPEERDRALKA